MPADRRLPRISTMPAPGFQSPLVSSRRLGRFRHLFSAVLVAILLFGCRFLTPSTQISATNRSIPADQIPLPKTAIAADLEKVEVEAWQDLRTPMQAELGAAADDLFKRADAMRAQMLAQARQEFKLSGGSAKPPGLAQFEAFSGVIVFLTEMVPKFATQEEGMQSKEVPFDAGAAKGTMKVTLSRAGATVVGDVEFSIDIPGANGAVLHETAKGVLEMQVCPDVNGRVPGKISLTMDSGGAGGGKSIGMQFNLSGQINLLVNDDANLEGNELDITSSFGSQVHSGSQSDNNFAEVHTNLTLTNLNGSGGSKVSGSGSQVTRASSKASAASYQAASNLGITMAIFVGILLGHEAEKIWQNGYCVEILIEGAQDANTVPVASNTAFTAKVRHKFEGNELNAPITAALEGEKSIAPTAKTKAPVKYNYTAPAEEKKLATIHLETRSKRGAAKHEVQFYTESPGWQLEQDVPVEGGTMTFKGLSCDGIDGPWEITYESDQTSALGFTITGKLEGLLQPNGSKSMLTHTVLIRYLTVVAEGNATGEVDAILLQDGDQYVIALNGGSIGGKVWAILPKVGYKSRTVNADPAYNVGLNVTPAETGRCPVK